MRTKHKTQQYNKISKIKRREDFVFLQLLGYNTRAGNVLSDRPYLSGVDKLHFSSPGNKNPGQPHKAAMNKPEEEEVKDEPIQEGKGDKKKKRKKTKRKPVLKKKDSKETVEGDKETSPPLALLGSDQLEGEDEREVISVLDKFLAQKRKENEQRLKAAEDQWKQDELKDENEKLDGEKKDKESSQALLLNKSPPEMKWKVKIFVVVNRLSGKGKKANVDEVLRREGGFRWKWDIFYIQTGKEDMAGEVREKVLKGKRCDIRSQVKLCFVREKI